MILEIVSARFFAPMIGTSIFVWTSVIGVMMTGLACGYSMGGILGDRKKSFPLLQHILYAAAVWIAMLALVRQPVISMLHGVMPGPMALAISATMALLFVPTVLLGMVSPYAVCLTVSDVRHVGDRVGNLATLSTVGSILGTFSAGFMLIPLLGTTSILLACACVLAFVAAGRSTKALLRLLLLLLLIAGVFFAERWLYTQRMRRHGYVAERESSYGNIRVQEVIAAQAPSGKMTRYLEINNGQHAGYIPETPNEHVFPYTAYYRISDAFQPQPQRALMLGGGGFTVVRDFLGRHQGSTADIVEIDPVVTEMADRYFDRPVGNAVHVFYDDARMFLNRAGPEGADGSVLGAYDIVYGDAFGSDHAIPFHLATVEAAQGVSAVLSERGVYVLNIIASDSGRSRRLLDAEVRTLQAVFPQVMAFRVPRPGTQAATGLMNVIVVASKQVVAPHELQATRTAGVQDMLANAIDVSDTAAAQLLTDDFAPVEALLYL